MPKSVPTLLLAPILLALALACSGGSTEAPAAEDGVEEPDPTGSAGRRARKVRRGRGGGGQGDVPPAGPSPAFRTFEADGGRYRLVFGSDAVKKTWNNMSGPAVSGRWRQSGDAVYVEYVPAEHHGSVAETFLVRGQCSLVRAERVDKDGRAVEDPKTYVLDEPQCR